MDYFIISKIEEYVVDCRCGFCIGFGCRNCFRTGVINFRRVSEGDAFIIFDSKIPWHQESAEKYGLWKKKGIKMKKVADVIINMDDI